MKILTLIAACALTLGLSAETIKFDLTKIKGKGRPDKYFWTGTATIQPMVLVNWSSADPETKTQFRNITLTIEK